MVNNNMRVFFALLRRETKLIGDFWKDSLINCGIGIFFQALVFGYFIPLMGMPSFLIAPIFLGTLGMFFITVGFNRSITWAADLAFDRFIDYQRTLPTRAPILLASYVMSLAIEMFCSTAPLFLFGKMILWNTLPLNHVHFGWFALTYGLILLSMSSFFAGLVFAIPFESYMGNIWPRLLTPLMCTGSIFFPWKALDTMAPKLARLLLLNPFTYITEGLRSSILGSNQFIAPWWCCIALLIFISCNISVLWHGYQKRFGTS